MVSIENIKEKKENDPSSRKSVEDVIYDPQLSDMVGRISERDKKYELMHKVIGNSAEGLKDDELDERNEIFREAIEASGLVKSVISNLKKDDLILKTVDSIEGLKKLKEDYPNSFKDFFDYDFFADAYIKNPSDVKGLEDVLKNYHETSKKEIEELNKLIEEVSKAIGVSELEIKILIRMKDPEEMSERRKSLVKSVREKLFLYGLRQRLRIIKDEITPALDSCIIKSTQKDQNLSEMQNLNIAPEVRKIFQGSGDVVRERLREMTKLRPDFREKITLKDLSKIFSRNLQSEFLDFLEEKKQLNKSIKKRETISAYKLIDEFEEERIFCGRNRNIGFWAKMLKKSLKNSYQDIFINIVDSFYKNYKNSNERRNFSK